MVDSPPPCPKAGGSSISNSQSLSASEESVTYGEKDSWEILLKYCRSSGNVNTFNITKALVFNTPSYSSTSSSCNISLDTDEENDFGMSILYPLSTATLNQRYDKQSLVTLICKEKTNFKNLTSSSLEIMKITNIIIFERGTDFQCYRLTCLGNCPHFTLLTKDIPTFIQGFQDYLPRPIEVIFVSKHVPFFSHPSLDAKVVNCSFNPDFSKKFTRSSEELFESGFANYFTLQDQGRGDIVGEGPLLQAYDNSGSTIKVKVTKKDRTIPTFTCGFSNMDCNRYRENRFTILGNTKPFIIGNKMDEQCKAAYLNFLKTCMDCPLSKGAFSLSKLSPAMREIRQSLLSDFFEAFGGNRSEPHSWLQNESNADLCVDQLSPHMDKQNSTLPGLDTVLGFTCHPRIDSLRPGQANDGEFKVDSDLKSKSNFNLLDYVLTKGYVDTFPHTHVKYMKGIVDTYVEKKVMLDEIASTDKLHSIMVWAITDTLNTHFDYRGSIFDNDLFLEKFHSESSKYEEDGGLLKGSHLKVKPAFDKMGTYSAILEMWNLMVVDFLPVTTVINGIDFAFYTCVTCNGLSLPWRVITDILENTTKSLELLKTVGNLFLFLRYMDQKLSSALHEANPKSKKRKVGSSSDNRSPPSNIAMITDWSGYSVTVMHVINVAFFNGSTEFLSVEHQELASTFKGRQLLEKVICSFHGIDVFFCNVLISVLSLMGIVPLTEYQHGTIADQWSSKTGPVQLAAACYDDDFKKHNKPTDVYNNIKLKINKAIGSNYVTAVLEDNLGCEVWRTYCNKLAKLGLRHQDEASNKLDIITDPNFEGESEKSDFYFWMPSKNAVQNVFLFLANGSRGFSGSRPGLMVRSTLDWQKGPSIYSDWTGKAPHNIVYWNKKNNVPFNAETNLIVTDKMKKLYHPPKRSQRKSKKPSRLHQEANKDFLDSICRMDD